MFEKKKYKTFTDSGDFYTNLAILTIQNAAMEYRKVLQYFVKYPEFKWKNEDHTYNEILKRKKQIQYSIDKYYRLACGFQWFPNEQITESERERILNKVKELQKVDIVLSHTCPEQWQPVDLFLPNIDQSKVDKSMEKWLSQVEENLDYDAWFFGHFHADRIIHMDVNRTVKMMFHQIYKVVLK